MRANRIVMLMLVGLGVAAAQDSSKTWDFQGDKVDEAPAGCKQVSGKTDEACGLVFRYQDENNYYVTRANALEDLDAKGDTFKDAGKVGVWTKADSVTYFDALSVKPLQ